MSVQVASRHQRSPLYKVGASFSFKSLKSSVSSRIPFTLKSFVGRLKPRNQVLFLAKNFVGDSAGNHKQFKSFLNHLKNEISRYRNGARDESSLHQFFDRLHTHSLLGSFETDLYSAEHSNQDRAYQKLFVNYINDSGFGGHSGEVEVFGACLDVLKPVGEGSGGGGFGSGYFPDYDAGFDGGDCFDSDPSFDPGASFDPNEPADLLSSLVPDVFKRPSENSDNDVRGLTALGAQDCEASFPMATPLAYGEAKGVNGDSVSESSAFKQARFGSPIPFSIDSLDPDKMGSKSSKDSDASTLLNTPLRVEDKSLGFNTETVEARPTPTQSTPVQLTPTRTTPLDKRKGYPKGVENPPQLLRRFSMQAEDFFAATETPLLVLRARNFVNDGKVEEFCLRFRDAQDFVNGKDNDDNVLGRHRDGAALNTPLRDAALKPLVYAGKPLLSVIPETFSPQEQALIFSCDEVKIKAILDFDIKSKVPEKLKRWQNLFAGFKTLKSF